MVFKSRDMFNIRRVFDLTASLCLNNSQRIKYRRCYENWKSVVLNLRWINTSAVNSQQVNGGDSGSEANVVFNTIPTLILQLKQFWVRFCSENRAWKSTCLRRWAPHAFRKSGLSLILPIMSNETNLGWVWKYRAIHMLGGEQAQNV